eukprot:5637622-Ditylum_brightwellii.AAC.1
MFVFQSPKFLPSYSTPLLYSLDGDQLQRGRNDRGPSSPLEGKTSSSPNFIEQERNRWQNIQLSHLNQDCKAAEKQMTDPPASLLHPLFKDNIWVQQKFHVLATFVFSFGDVTDTVTIPLPPCCPNHKHAKVLYRCTIGSTMFVGKFTTSTMQFPQRMGAL